MLREYTCYIESGYMYDITNNTIIMSVQEYNSGLYDDDIIITLIEKENKKDV